MWKRWAIRILGPAVQEAILTAVMTIPDVERKAAAISLLKEIKRNLVLQGESQRNIAQLIPFDQE